MTLSDSFVKAVLQAFTEFLDQKVDPNHPVGMRWYCTAIPAFRLIPPAMLENMPQNLKKALEEAAQEKKLSIRFGTDPEKGRFLDMYPD